MQPLSRSAKSTRVAPSIPAKTRATQSAPAAVAASREPPAGSSANTRTTRINSESAINVIVLSPRRTSRRKSLRIMVEKPAILAGLERARTAALAVVRNCDEPPTQDFVRIEFAAFDNERCMRRDDNRGPTPERFP